MKLELDKPKSNLRSQLGDMSRTTKSSIEQSQQEYQPSTWVKLIELPSPWSFDEALLLCEYLENQWYVWVPDYGVIVMHTSHFGKTQSLLQASRDERYIRE